MLGLIRQFLRELDAAGRRRLAWLGLAMTVTAILDVAGVGAIIPFTTLLVQTDVVANEPFVRQLMAWTGLSSTRELTVLLGLATLAVLVLVNVLQIATIWLQLDTIWHEGRRLSARLLAAYLARPYAWFLHRNTSGLVNSLFQEITRTIGSVLDPALTLVARGMAALALIGFLIYLNPLIALGATFFLGGAYGLLYLLLRPVIVAAGDNAKRDREEAHLAATEALSGIKDVKLAGLAAFMLQRYVVPSTALAGHEATTRMMAYAPRYVLETAVLGVFIIAALLLTSPGAAQGSAVPLLATYAFAGYRLLPNLQQVYASLTLIRYNIVSLEEIMRDIREGEAAALAAQAGAGLAAGPGRIALEKLSFAYDGSARPVLEAVDFVIEPRTSIAITGETGSGKSTLLDLVMGLLLPTSGRITIDGTTLTPATAAAWQARIGYVPQQLYLIDDTVAANIAFGVPRSDIDMERVKRAALDAQLHDVIVAFEHGYDTRVGERGSRLSSGQRQRLGIARALYRQPQVLVLDEATSALDYETEQAVIDAVSRLSHELTIIMIAHRLHTIAGCDVHYVVGEGRVVEAPNPALADSDKGAVR